MYRLVAVVCQSTLIYSFAVDMVAAAEPRWSVECSFSGYHHHVVMCWAFLIASCEQVLVQKVNFVCTTKCYCFEFADNAAGVHLKWRLCSC